MASSSDDAQHRAFLKRTMVKSAATKVDVGLVLQFLRCEETFFISFLPSVSLHTYQTHFLLLPHHLQHITLTLTFFFLLLFTHSLDSLSPLAFNQNQSTAKRALVLSRPFIQAA